MSATESKTAQPKQLVTVTDTAALELKRLFEQEESDADGVRLGVKGGGCSGLSYALEFSRERESDHVIEQDGVRFYLDRKSAIYLTGIVLDYKEGLSGKGFVFPNPNATSTCGCGESFSV